MAFSDTKFSPVDTEDRKRIDIRPGDTVRVLVKVQEKGKTRLQPFEGVVLSRSHGSEPGATFTVRRVSDGYGVEKIFPLYSPAIDKIEIVKRSRVRRSKLYYIREKAAREIRRQMRRMKAMDVSTKSGAEETNKEAGASSDAEVPTESIGKEAVDSK